MAFRGWKLKEYGQPKREVGQGTYGYIYSTTKNYVIKVIDFETEPLISQYELGEIIYPHAVSHPNIIAYHDIFLEGSRIFVAMDHYDEDGVAFALRIQLGLQPEARLTLVMDVARQLISAVACLHAHDILHRDIKPSNIFFRVVDGNVQCVLADFGFAVGHGSTMVDLNYDVYTASYRPPEVALSTPYSSKADVWALGCTLHFLYTGVPRFSIPGPGTPVQIITALHYQLGDPEPACPFYFDWMDMVALANLDMNKPGVVWPADNELYRLVDRMVVVHPDDRASCADLGGMVVPISAPESSSISVAVPESSSISVAVPESSSISVAVPEFTPPPNRHRLITKCLKLKFRLQASPAAFLLAVTLLDRSNYRPAEVAAVFFLAMSIHHIHLPRGFQDILYPRESRERFQNRINRIIHREKCDLYINTPYDRLIRFPGITESTVLEVAAEILVVAAIAPAMYQRDDLLNLVVEMATRLLGEPSQNVATTGAVLEFARELRSLYIDHPSLVDELSPIVRLSLSLEDD